MESRPLHVWILSDGRAGHANQSRAIAMALGRRFRVETSLIPCKLRAGLWQRPLEMLLRLAKGRLPLRWMPCFLRIGPLPVTQPDLIVSAGGHTCHANAWLAASLGKPNLFCGEIRRLPEGLFAGVLTGYPWKAGKAPYRFSPTPVPIDPVEIRSQGLAWKVSHDPNGGPCWSLLVGGEGAGYRYDDGDWSALGKALAELAMRYGIRWLVSTSRRTGTAAEAILSTTLPAEAVAARLFAGDPGVPVITYPEILGLAERHFVTEDSHMMISEAIATGRPVETLQPRHFRTHPTNRHFLEFYHSQNWLRRHAIRSVSQADFPPEDPAHPAPDILESLAAQLADWWQSLPLGKNPRS